MQQVANWCQTRPHSSTATSSAELTSDSTADQLAGPRESGRGGCSRWWSQSPCRCLLVAPRLRRLLLCHSRRTMLYSRHVSGNHPRTRTWRRCGGKQRPKSTILNDWRPTPAVGKRGRRSNGKDGLVGWLKSPPRDESIRHYLHRLAMTVALSPSALLISRPLAGTVLAASLQQRSRWGSNSASGIGTRFVRYSHSRMMHTWITRFLCRSSSR